MNGISQKHKRVFEIILTEKQNKRELFYWGCLKKPK